MSKLNPHLPSQMPEYADTCLQALIAKGLGDRISLGGAIGLMHYFEYRTTHDVDAWWRSDTTFGERQQVVATLEAALRPFGQVRTRTWGDVVSVELLSKQGRVFSFQIAGRSAQLEPSVVAPEAGMLLDSFVDLVASKMVALVERGAPRDFLDIYTLCHENLTTPESCWELWRRRQTLAGSNTEANRAKLAVQTHLARIEQCRPLEEISDPPARDAAAEVRSWFKTEFLDALS